MRIFTLATLSYSSGLSVRCKNNEIFKSCGSTCEPTCGQDQQLQACATVCVEKCFCDKGYLRDPQNDKCVKPRHCESGF